jgi:DeoR family transcriptional regulator, suf operon transcriptional repressor
MTTAPMAPAGDQAGDLAHRSGLASLPPTRRELVNVLKKQGTVDADDLAARVGLSTSAVRQQLAALQRDGLVTFDEVKHGVGRPRHRYRLTAAGDSLFPRAYANLTNELLDYVGESDPELVEEIFSRRRQRRIDDAMVRLAGKSFEAKVAELARILDDDGYLAEMVPVGDGSYRVIEHNCAILGIALRYGQACGSELEFIRAVLPDAVIERTDHMVAGAFNCSYLVTPR